MDEILQESKETKDGKVGMNEIRLIDAYTFAKRLDRCVGINGLGLEPVMAIRDIKALLSVIPTVDAAPVPMEADGWISVKDRLPEERENWITRDWQHVICCCDFGGDPRRIDVRTYGFGRGHFWHGPQIMDGVVTHWMPLPDPPEADERSGDE